MFDSKLEEVKSRHTLLEEVHQWGPALGVYKFPIFIIILYCVFAVEDVNSQLPVPAAVSGTYCHAFPHGELLSF